MDVYDDEMESSNLRSSSEGFGESSLDEEDVDDNFYDSEESSNLVDEDEEDADEEDDSDDADQ